MILLTASYASIRQHQVIGKAIYREPFHVANTGGEYVRCMEQAALGLESDPISEESSVSSHYHSLHHIEEIELCRKRPLIETPQAREESIRNTKFLMHT